MGFRIIRSALAAVFLFLSFGTLHAQEADAVMSFRLFQAKEGCGERAKSNAERRACIWKVANQLTAKMRDDILCDARTCVARVRCNGDRCSQNGYSVDFVWADTGYDINVTLPSGKKAQYGQCGTCSNIEAVDDAQMPIEVLRGEGYVILEFLARYK
ncbi:hypothetical protein [Methyloraptor flagellatus]|uniref:Uncharacterized protein n=1 Tax=Methyloraptor flagellatus TaxID=3162530 RepID=A0AAU7XF70_9HYPH